MEKEGAIEGKEDDDGGDEDDDDRAAVGDAVALPAVEEVPFVALSLAETEDKEVEGAGGGE